MHENEVIDPARRLILVAQPAWSIRIASKTTLNNFMPEVTINEFLFIRLRGITRYMVHLKLFPVFLSHRRRLTCQVQLHTQWQRTMAN